MKRCPGLKHLETGERPLTEANRSLDREFVDVTFGGFRPFSVWFRRDCSKIPLGIRSRAQLRPVSLRASAVASVGTSLGERLGNVSTTEGSLVG